MITALITCEQHNHCEHRQKLRYVPFDVADDHFHARLIWIDSHASTDMCGAVLGQCVCVSDLPAFVVNVHCNGLADLVQRDREGHGCFSAVNNHSTCRRSLSRSYIASVCFLDFEEALMFEIFIRHRDQVRMWTIRVHCWQVTRSKLISIGKKQFIDRCDFKTRRRKKNQRKECLAWREENRSGRKEWTDLLRKQTVGNDVNNQNNGVSD